LTKWYALSSKLLSIPSLDIYVLYSDYSFRSDIPAMFLAFPQVKCQGLHGLDSGALGHPSCKGRCDTFFISHCSSLRTFYAFPRRLCGLLAKYDVLCVDQLSLYHSLGARLALQLHGVATTNNDDSVIGKVRRRHLLLQKPVTNCPLFSLSVLLKVLLCTIVYRFHYLESGTKREKAEYRVAKSNW
jgi:hypothetical protein